MAHRLLSGLPLLSHVFDRIARPTLAAGTLHRPEKGNLMNNSLTPPIPSQRHFKPKAFVGLALLGLLTAATGVVATRAGVATSAVPGLASAGQTSHAFTHVTKQVSPAVVFIKAEKRSPVNHLLRGESLPSPFDEEWL